MLVPPDDANESTLSLHHQVPCKKRAHSYLASLYSANSSDSDNFQVCDCKECNTIFFSNSLPDIPLSMETLLVHDLPAHWIQNPRPRRFRVAEHICASGSAQLSTKQLEFVASRVGADRLIIVDLRNESHGFIGSIPCSWFRCRNLINLGKSSADVESAENYMLLGLRRRDATKQIRIHRVKVKLRGSIYGSEEVSVEESVTRTEIRSEREICQALGIEYRRFPVVDHNRPEDEIVDAFVELCTNSSSTDWIHFHCKGGRGRSTCFMLMLDMIRIRSRNKTPDSFETMVRNHKEIGGSDLLRFSTCKNKEWKRGAHIRRLLLLRRFYEYCLCKEGLGNRSWSQWVSQFKGNNDHGEDLGCPCKEFHRGRLK